MNLPLSRTIDLDPSDPIPSALLDEIQDCIVATAHQSLPLILGSDCFAGAGFTGNHSPLGYLSVSSASSARATIKAWTGTIINSVSVYYDRNGTGSMLPKLRRMSILTGVITDIWVGFNDSSSSGMATQSAAPSHIMLPDNNYWVESSFATTDNRLYAAKLMLSRPV